MARIRTIKPEFFDDEEIGRLSDKAQIVFIGLWTQADRDGRLEDRPERLRTRLRSYDPECNMETTLTELADCHFIVRYQHEGRRLIQIRTFQKHQVINQREAEGVLPGHGQKQVHARACTCVAGVEGKGTGTGKEQEGEKVAADAAVLAGFDRFWSAYPRKDAKQEAMQAWRKLNPDETLTETILSRLEIQKGWSTWTDMTYVPQAQRWIRRRRWEDEPVKPQDAPKRLVPRSGLSPICPHDPSCRDGSDACKRRQLDEFKAGAA